MTEQPYDKRYAEDPSYWGKEPTTIAQQFVRQGLPLLHERFPGGVIRIVDIGCGDGRDALYYAQQGIHVTGVDISKPGLAALSDKAVTAGLSDLIETTAGDIATFRLRREYHAIVSSGALHYIPPGLRGEAFANYKSHVLPGGIVAVSVIIDKPFIEPAPDQDPNVTFFRSGEALQYLWDWDVLWFLEEIRPCNSSGVPHRHAFNRIIASRPF